jgi:hypothetical protein
MQRETSPATNPHPGEGWPLNAPPSLARGLPGPEQAVIDAALAILARRVSEPGAVVNDPGATRELLRLQLAQCERERFAVLFLDAQHAAIAFEVLFEGTLTQTAIYPREVVRRALQLNACAVILAHNHPSGKAEPSRADELLTHSLRHALAMVDVRVIDHFVIGWPAMASMFELGLMEPEPPGSEATGRKVQRKRATPSPKPKPEAMSAMAPANWAIQAREAGTTAARAKRNRPTVQAHGMQGQSAR